VVYGAVRIKHRLTGWIFVEDTIYSERQVGLALQYSIQGSIRKFLDCYCCNCLGKR
jgi:hypothetical protein